MLYALIITTCLGALVLLGLWERLERDRAWRAIPIRIHINGSRGKSAITRLVWGALAEAYRTGAMSPAKQKSAVKGRIPALVACFQAMRDWPSIDPGEVRCPALLLAGSRNTGVMKWIAANRQALDRANVQIEIVDGLDHPQEFSQVEQVYPLVAPFLKKYE